MKEELNSKDYWNKVADKKEFTTPFQEQLFLKYIDKKANILDVGCGYGRTLDKLSSMGYENLYGVDISEQMIRRATKKNPTFKLKVKEGERIDFVNNTFDAVILLAVLTCIIDKEEQKRLIAEIVRVLKDGGILYINDYLLNEDQRNLNRYEQFKDKYNSYGVFELAEGARFRHHRVEWIKELIEGFEDIVLEEVVYTTMNGNKSNGFYYMGRKRL